MLKIERKALEVSLAHLAPMQLVELYKTLGKIAKEITAAKEIFSNGVPPGHLADEEADEIYTYGIEPAYEVVEAMLRDAEAFAEAAQITGEMKMGTNAFWDKLS